MPELPEVETIKKGLVRLIVGKTIMQVEVHDSPKSFPNDPVLVEEFMHGAQIISVCRRAKVLLIELSTNYSVVIHLRMTGQLIYADQTKRFGGGHPTDSLVGALPDRFTRVVISFRDGGKLFFNDLRKFGWIKLYPTPEVELIDFMKRVGPEPLEDATTGEVLYERLQRRKNTLIKAALLDQSVIAGVGNIYADEALWGAQIHPSTRVRDVTKAQAIRLMDEIKAILTLAIDQGGSTDRNYTDAEGNRGNYLQFARVFRREGKPCPRHPDVLIEKIRVAGRGTHVCPVCQPVTQ